MIIYISADLVNGRDQNSVLHDLEVKKGGTMRKFNMLMLTALTIAPFVTTAFTHVQSVSAQDSGHVGVVVAYVPRQSITIVDQSGGQHEFQLASSVKILPPKRASALAVGSFVTIIAPNSIFGGKQVAVGLVVHPHVPNGWNIVAITGTPVATTTIVGTLTATPNGALLTTETAATPTSTVTATPTVTPLGGTSTTPTTDSFIQWLTSLIRQVLANQ